MCALCGVASHIPETPLAPGPAANAADRTRFAALKNPDCRNYIGGASLSMMGDSIEHVITYWVIFQQFHSPALAGFAVGVVVAQRVGGISALTSGLSARLRDRFGGNEGERDDLTEDEKRRLLSENAAALYGVTIP